MTSLAGVVDGLLVRRSRLTVRDDTRGTRERLSAQHAAGPGAAAPDDAETFRAEIRNGQRVLVGGGLRQQDVRGSAHVHVRGSATSRRTQRWAVRTVALVLALFAVGLGLRDEQDNSPAHPSPGAPMSSEPRDGADEGPSGTVPDGGSRGGP